MTDPLADMFSRIRNATQAKHRKVDIPSSKVKLSIAALLLKERFIINYKLIKDQKQGMVRLYLRYTEDEVSVIQGLTRVSKPGRRVYVDKNNIPRVKGRVGIVVISTSAGIMAGDESRRRGLGGEIIGYVW
jgi:small subunit ribosomal protein S8